MYPSFLGEDDRSYQASSLVCTVSKEGMICWQMFGGLAHMRAGGDGIFYRCLGDE